jgi:hypothetical protein
VVAVALPLAALKEQAGQAAVEMVADHRQAAALTQVVAVVLVTAQHPATVAAARLLFV